MAIFNKNIHIPWPFVYCVCTCSEDDLKENLMEIFDRPKTEYHGKNRQMVFMNLVKNKSNEP